MNEIEKILTEQATLENKKLSQIISFLGEGKLTDCDSSFRFFLEKIQNELLIKYAEERLEKGFNDSGLALQDIVNEIGKRLGFNITNGLYRGKQSEIGFDGIWKEQDDWVIVVEVKTTDAYRISLDTIAEYRNRLIKSQGITKDNSSILIVVGRNDTGELEAQIRGSRHAWDIRIISVDSLIRLLKVKESLSDESTAKKISMALRPYEYTRVDKLIELLFLAIKDIEIEESADDFIDDEESDVNNIENQKKEKTKPVSFHGPVFQKAKEELKLNFIKKSRSSYASTDESVGLIVSISKKHKSFNSQFDARYWFAFHPHQDTFLSKYKARYICYGCGSAKSVFMLPSEFLFPRLENMWKTNKEERLYTHIVIYQKDNQFFLRTNIEEKQHYEDLSSFRI
ncbi:hypothetical protein [Thiorhodovibrio litoralis]|uniref:hypothetical protein n=1 Tax=Thiorhodovibrio litoralis TaxID=2952932 RepID=UPI002B25C552|nr:hypothetical protein [Thiorhodovibrio litoralis]WPL12478.1 hypothetical protein Thiosp_02247 [Thiorhodovibrio litoralis]